VVLVGYLWGEVEATGFANAAELVTDPPTEDDLSVLMDAVRPDVLVRLATIGLGTPPT
jgi:hypothetical protein